MPICGGPARSSGHLRSNPNISGQRPDSRTVGEEIVVGTSVSG